MSKRLYPQWRGGYYYAARPKNNPGAPLGLMYVSRWSSAEKAAEFAEIYARSLSKRYKKAEEIKTAAAPDAEEEQPRRKVELLLGRHSWNTDEGTVMIEAKGDTVLVSESVDAADRRDCGEREVFRRKEVEGLARTKASPSGLSVRRVLPPGNGRTVAVTVNCLPSRSRRQFACFSRPRLQASAEPVQE